LGFELRYRNRDAVFNEILCKFLSAIAHHNPPSPFFPLFLLLIPHSFFPPFLLPTVPPFPATPFLILHSCRGHPDSFCQHIPRFFFTIFLLFSRCFPFFLLWRPAPLFLTLRMEDVFFPPPFPPNPLPSLHFSLFFSKLLSFCRFLSFLDSMPPGGVHFLFILLFLYPYFPLLLSF